MCHWLRKRNIKLYIALLLQNALCPGPNMRVFQIAVEKREVNFDAKKNGNPCIVLFIVHIFCGLFEEPLYVYFQKFASKELLFKKI